MTAANSFFGSHPDPSASSGGRMVCLDGRQLALVGSELRTEAAGGVARVVVEQRFRNIHAEPLSVSYLLPLPPDAVVSGFGFRIGERDVLGRVEAREEARAHFEEAILEGRTATLLEQERSSLFTQEIGNVPPGTLLVARVELDQRLRWLEEGAWEWRFPTVVAPRYLGAANSLPDSGRIMVDVADPEQPARLSTVQLSLRIGDSLATEGQPSSPSHDLRITAQSVDGSGALHVAFAHENHPLDRDVVVRWPVATLLPGVFLSASRGTSLGVGSDDAYGLLTVVPPLPRAAAASLPRDLIVLLDTSGSMTGEPLAQAKRVVRTLIESLGDVDRLELIEFSESVRRWKWGAVRATRAAREKALAWLAGLEASGATEMRAGILAALASLRKDAQRQVLIVTDGLIGAEESVVTEILRRLPPQTRVHALGIGSAVNRTLTGGVARAGRGVEVIVGPHEDTASAAARLLARMVSPLVTDLEISGEALREHAPAALPDLFAGAPALLALRLRPEGGSLRLRGRAAAGIWEAQLDVRPMLADLRSNAAATLYARERVEDLEARAAAGQGEAVDAQILHLGLEFQIATRLTSWVAISEEKTVDPRQPIRRERLAHMLPQGMSAEGLGLRRAPLERILSRPPSRMSLQDAGRGRAGFLHSIEDDIVECSLRSDFECASAERMLAHSSLLDLVGRIVYRSAGRLVIEIELPDPLAWAPEQALRLRLDDGRWIDAVLDAEGTTASGLVEAGRCVRLALDAGEAARTGQPVEIEFAIAGCLVRLRIGA